MNETLQRIPAINRLTSRADVTVPSRLVLVSQPTYDNPSAFSDVPRDRNQRFWNPVRRNRRRKHNSGVHTDDADTRTCTPLFQSLHATQIRRFDYTRVTGAMATVRDPCSGCAISHVQPRKLPITHARRVLLRSYVVRIISGCCWMRSFTSASATLGPTTDQRWKQRRL